MYRNRKSSIQWHITFNLMSYILFFVLLCLPTISEAEISKNAKDKAADINKLLLKGEVEQISLYFDDSIRQVSIDGTNYLTEVIEGLFSKKASQAELHALDSWIEKHETSAWARILRAAYYINQLRRFPAKVFTAEKRDSFLQKLIDQAAEDAEVGVRLARDNICARYMHLKIARYQNFKHEYQKRFEVLIKLSPQYFQAYQERLIQLAPRSGGSIRDVVNFSKQTSLSYDNKSVLKSLPLFAHKILSEDSKNAQKYLSKKNVIEDIQESERLVSQAFPKSSKYLRLFSMMASKGGYDDLAQRAMRQAEDREQATSYFQD